MCVVKRWRAAWLLLLAIIWWCARSRLKRALLTHRTTTRDHGRGEPSRVCLSQRSLALRYLFVCLLHRKWSTHRYVIKKHVRAIKNIDGARDCICKLHVYYIYIYVRSLEFVFCALVYVCACVFWVGSRCAHKKWYIWGVDAHTRNRRIYLEFSQMKCVFVVFVCVRFMSACWFLAICPKILLCEASTWSDCAYIAHLYANCLAYNVAIILKNSRIA